MIWRRVLPLAALVIVAAACQGSAPPTVTSTTLVAGTTTSTTPAESLLRVVAIGKLPERNWWAIHANGNALERAWQYGATPSLFTGTGLEPLPDLALLPLGIPRPDGVGWVLDQKITPDRRWADGEPVRASDLVFYFETTRRLTLDGEHAIHFPEGILAIEAPDELTVRIRFDRPPGPALWPGAVGLAPFVPSHHWAPQLVDVGDRLTLYAIDGPPPPRGAEPAVEWLWAPSREAAYRLLVSGEVELVHDAEGVAGLDPELVAGLEASDGIALTTSVRQAVRVLAFNQRRAPFDDPVFRTALSTVVDRFELAETLDVAPAYSFHRPDAERPVGPGAFDGEHLDRASRMDKAVASLSAAGYSWSVPPQVIQATGGSTVVPGSGLTRPGGSPVGELRVLVAADDPMRVAAADLVAASFADLGIEVLVEAVPAADLAGTVLPPLTAERAAAWDMAILGWRGTGPSEPGALLVHLFHSSEDSVLGGGTNVTGYSSAAFDALVERYQGTASPARARDLLEEMELLIGDGSPQLPLYRETVTEAHAASLPFAPVVDGISSAPSSWPFQLP